jgi:hypothetical protein
MVTARGGAPATGATVEIKSRTPRVSSPVGLPFVFYPTPAILGTDGRFEFYDVVPGEYTVQASYSEVRGESRTVVISTQSIRDLNLSIPVSVLTGQIFAEDGTAFPDAEAFVEVLMTAVGNPRMAVTTKLPIAGDGTFRRILEQDTYRFRLRVLPEEYSVTSIRAGNAELLNQTLIVGTNEPAPVRVVVGRKTALQNQPRRVSGTV